MHEHRVVAGHRVVVHIAGPVARRDFAEVAGHKEAAGNYFARGKVIAENVLVGRMVLE